MASKSREELIRELNRLKAINAKKTEQLRERKKAIEQVKKINAEKKMLKREIFELKHSKKIAAARVAGKGAKVIGRGVGIAAKELGKGLKAYHKYQKGKKKSSGRR